MIVELGNERLRCANSEYYTLDGSTTAYLVPGTAEETAANVSSGDIAVTRIDNTNNVTVNLNYLQDFTISQVPDATSTLVWQVNLLSAYNNGDSLIVSVENSNEYFIDAGKLRLNSSLLLTFIISENAINADASPPNPLKIATICGIEVICTFLANVRPIMPPSIIPEAI